jgi:hypothetical protein
MDKVAWIEQGITIHKTYIQEGMEMMERGGQLFIGGNQSLNDPAGVIGLSYYEIKQELKTLSNAYYEIGDGVEKRRQNIARLELVQEYTGLSEVWEAISYTKKTIQEMEEKMSEIEVYRNILLGFAEKAYAIDQNYREAVETWVTQRKNTKLGLSGVNLSLINDLGLPKFKDLNETQLKNLIAQLAIASDSKGKVDLSNKNGTAAEEIDDFFYEAASASLGQAFSRFLKNYDAFDDDGNMLDLPKNRTLDWNDIAETLAKSADQITKAEYYALAKLYTEMDAKDMEKFLGMLADKKGESAKPLNKYTTWQYDPGKISGLQEQISKIVFVLNAEQLQQTPASSKSLSLLAELEKVMQSSGLLTVIGSITGSKKYYAGLVSETTAVIEGEAGAKMPNLKLVQDKDGNLTLIYRQATKNTAYNQNGIPIEVELFVNKSAFVGSTAIGLDSEIKIINAYLNELSSYNFGEETVTTYAGLGLGALIGAVNGAKSANLYTFLLDPLIGVVNDLDEQQGIKDTSGKINELLTESDFATHFALFSNAIINGDNDIDEANVLFFPSPKTTQRVDNLNWFIEDRRDTNHPINKIAEELGRPITVEDVFGDLDLMKRLYLALTPEERHDVFTDRILRKENEINK